MTDEHSHRIFASLYDPVMAIGERRFLSDEREELTSDLEGNVLELGAGTGEMFTHYPPEATVHAIEPDPHMLKRARRRAEEASEDVNLVRGVGEELPYGDETFDYAVSPVVLCTVGDISETLAEVQRVLRSGGELRFLEHVHDEGLVGRAQDVANPLWRRLAGGCNLNRDTLSVIESVFGEGETTHEVVGGMGLVRPFVRGRAEK